ncbi:uncharacterized protein LOC133304947 [Gastrolobium bilobum]|uniref:uncharacterized protein LOC133304947 n=1 Tax=Gastrolobium bilobum TaxID=150636 RepID=UPI002AB0FEBB|nr:uncharacterized protein LOC133304947 [Gastrolobium bilobum]
MEKSIPKGQASKPSVETPAASNRPPPPFPQRLQKQKQDNQFRKFLDLLKQLHVNIPLVDALEQMHTYVKFMKEILSRKRRLEKLETVALTEESSQYLLSKLSRKLGDPGSFTIPCTIGDHYISRALCDLGASINLMPISVFKKLKVGEPNPTTITLQLADRSLVYPEGNVENVLVKADKFILPADFIILDYEEEREVPIILGRAFLSIGGAVIDVKEGELAMNVNGEQVKFNILKAMKYPRDIEECSRLDIIDCVVKDKFLHETALDSFEISGYEAREMSQTDSEEVMKWLNSRSELLKPLPKQLRYAYLGEKDIFPVIVSNLLTVLEEEQLLAVLKKFKRAIGWSLADIKGYNQIALAPEDQPKTTFTCPYDIFAFSRMPFGLCNAPVTFQRCMMAIFTDMIEQFVEVFMEDFSVFGDSYKEC